jgi:hypothetical protein
MRSMALRLRGGVLPVTPAAVLPAIGLILGWRGGDLAAQMFRASMYRNLGFAVWDNFWFGGHPTLEYSIVMPVLASHVDPRYLAAIAGVVAAIVFALIARRAWPTTAWIATLWFATATATNFAVGRVTFALGLAFGLVAVAAMQRQWAWLAALAGLVTACTSPVAGLFVAIAAAAWGLSNRRRRVAAAIVLVCTLAPTLLVSALFPVGGYFPYEGYAVARDLAICALVYVAAGRAYPVLRTGAVLYAITCLGAFLVHTPLGGNVSRLAEYAAGPIVAALWWRRRAMLLALAAVPLVLWQWLPAVDGMTQGASDPAAHASYYQPLLSYLHAAQPEGRVEVPALLHHWESVYVAETYPLARGWERQLDRDYDHIFYDGTLTPASYHTWLVDNAVQYVALGDAKIDTDSAAEAALLKHPQPFLTPVLMTQHWHVWRVVGYDGYVEGAGHLESIGTDRFTVDVRAPSDVLVRIHYTPRWSTGDGACVTRGPNDWTVIRAAKAGRYVVRPAWFPEGCPDR